MAVNLDEVQGGQHIVSSDGEDLGKVHGLTTDPTTNPATRYLEVNRSGLFDLAGDRLYIPEDMIADVRLGGVIRLKITRDEAMERYQYKPESAL